MADIPVLSLIQARIESKDLSDLIYDLEEVSEQIPIFLQTVEAQIGNTVRGMYLDNFYSNAIDSGMPFPYINHLYTGIIEKLNFSVDFDGDNLYINVPAISDLGDEEMLYDAVHNQAIAEIGSNKDFSVSNPPRVGIGADESSLYHRRGANEGLDQEKRLEFFEAIMDEAGVFPVVLGGEKNSHIFYAPVPSRDEVFLARTIFWGNNYPEWILLELGDPLIGINPTGFDFEFEYLIEQRIAGIIEGLADKIVTALETNRRFNPVAEATAEVDKSGQLKFRSPTGTYARQYE